MDDEQARRAWLLPIRTGVVDGLELAYLDPADEDDRSVLFRIEHPELWEALDLELDEITLQGQSHGQTMSPRLHLTLHEVVGNQIWANDPPETWATAQRLIDDGYDRHEVLHMLASVASTQVFHALKGTPYAPERFAQDLAALPASWEADRPVAPTNRAERRAHAKRRWR